MGWEILNRLGSVTKEMSIAQESSSIWKTLGFLCRNHEVSSSKAMALTIHIYFFSVAQRFFNKPEKNP